MQLAIVKEIVQPHAEKIRVEGKIGKGSKFFVEPSTSLKRRAKNDNY